jgi:hypothetical protein
VQELTPRGARQRPAVAGDLPSEADPGLEPIHVGHLVAGVVVVLHLVVARAEEQGEPASQIEAVLGEDRPQR